MKYWSKKHRQIKILEHGYHSFNYKFIHVPNFKTHFLLNIEETYITKKYLYVLVESILQKPYLGRIQ